MKQDLMVNNSTRLVQIIVTVPVTFAIAGTTGMIK